MNTSMRGREAKSEIKRAGRVQYRSVDEGCSLRHHTRVNALAAVSVLESLFTGMCAPRGRDGTSRRSIRRDHSSRSASRFSCGWRGRGVPRAGLQRSGMLVKRPRSAMMRSARRWVSRIEAP